MAEGERMVKIPVAEYERLLGCFVRLEMIRMTIEDEEYISRRELNRILGIKKVESNE